MAIPLARADTEYEFDPISTQGWEEIAQIERDALNPAPQVQDEGNMEGSGEEMDRDEIIVQYLKPGWDYGDINDKILSAISRGMVACIRGHYETRSALWSPKTCFAELGIKPQFEVTLDDENTTLRLADILNGVVTDNLLFAPTSQWCLPPSMQELEDSYNALWGKESYSVVPPKAAQWHSFLHFLVPNPTSIQKFTGALTCTMMEVKQGNARIVFFRHKNWFLCSTIEELNAIVSQMNCDNVPEKDLEYEEVVVGRGDCFVIPPGTNYDVSPTSNTILACSNFYHRCNLHHTYGLVRVDSWVPGNMETFKQYWVQVYRDIAKKTPPSLFKLRAIMMDPHEGDKATLFSGSSWLDPYL